MFQGPLDLQAAPCRPGRRREERLGPGMCPSPPGCPPFQALQLQENRKRALWPHRPSRMSPIPGSAQAQRHPSSLFSGRRRGPGVNQPSAHHPPPAAPSRCQGLASCQARSAAHPESEGAARCRAGRAAEESAVGAASEAAAARRPGA